MGKSVTIKPGFTSFRGPSPLGYKAYLPGATVIYTDAEYSALPQADLRCLNSPSTVPDPSRPAVDTASKPVNVVTAATGTVPVVTGANRLTLTGNVTLTFPTKVAGGNDSEVSAYLIQDGTGSRTLTLPAAAKAAGGTAPVLSTGANKVDYLVWRTYDGGTTWDLVNKQLDIR